jgi:hypothetical protein
MAMAQHQQPEEKGTAKLFQARGGGRRKFALEGLPTRRRTTDFAVQGN